MSRLRTFIAVEVDDSVRTRLVAVQHTLARAGGDVKWVEEDNLHVTLLFLGEVDDRDLHKVCRAVASGAASVPAFSMSVEGIRCFGNPRRPRTMWAGVGEGREELVALHAAIESPLLELGCYRREERAYTPHITLGRVRGETDGDRLAAALGDHENWSGGECEVRRVVVMSSELRSEGPLYTVLSRAALGKSR